MYQATDYNYGGRTRYFSVGTGATQISQGGNNTVCVLISSPISGRITISEDPNVVDQNGIILNNGVAPLKLERLYFGDLITLPLYACTNTSAQTIGVTLIQAKG